MRNRAAFSMAEVAIAVLVLGAAITPIYSIFINSSKTAVSSKLAYMAAQVARETMDELRTIPFDRLDEVKIDQPTSVEGSLWAMTAKIRGDLPGTPPPPTYPEEYKRIKRTIKFADVDASTLPAALIGQKLRPRLKKVILDVFWEEQGGRDEKSRPGLQHYVTFLGSHSVDPEVQE